MKPIPIEERKPEHEKEVLVRILANGVPFWRVGFLDDMGYWHIVAGMWGSQWENQFVGMSFRVTHWMELPEEPV